MVESFHSLNQNVAKVITQHHLALFTPLPGLVWLSIIFETDFILLLYCEKEKLYIFLMLSEAILVTEFSSHQAVVAYMITGRNRALLLHGLSPVCSSFKNVVECHSLLLTEGYYYRRLDGSVRSTVLNTRMDRCAAIIIYRYLVYCSYKKPTDRTLPGITVICYSRLSWTYPMTVTISLFTLDLFICQPVSSKVGKAAQQGLSFRDSSEKFHQSTALVSDAKLPYPLLYKG
jgi:hypothetical protein